MCLNIILYLEVERLDKPAPGSYVRASNLWCLEELLQEGRRKNRMATAPLAEKDTIGRRVMPNHI
jgi:hypothetical protein